MSTSEVPWKIRVLLRFCALLMDASLRPDITVNRWLVNILDRRVPPSQKPIDGVVSSDVTIDGSRDLWVRIYTPVDGEDALSIPVVVFYHGGGFVFGPANSTSSESAARRLARELRAVVISVNYRLAPEYRFPCQYEDGFDALKFIDGLDEGILPSNADLSRCFIAGESAGGNLGHHMAVKASEYDFKRLKLIGLISTQPFFGGEERTEPEIRLSQQVPLTLKFSDWFWKAFLPVDSDRDHAATNVFGPNGTEISGIKFPATIIFVGGLDPLQEWQRRYYEGLKRSGSDVKLVNYPNAIHGFFGFPELPETSWMFQEMRDFMAEQLNK